MDLMAVFAGTVAPIGTTTVKIDPEMPGQVPQAVEVAAPLAALFNAADVRREMAGIAGLETFAAVTLPTVSLTHEPDMEVVEL